MAIVQITRPEGITEEMYDAVNERMGGEMPAGMLLHAAGRDESGTFEIVDVWESRDAMRRFEDERLRPAIAAVMGERGMDAEQAPPPNQTTFETYRMMGSAVAGAR
jgi:hypothetical protein